MASVADMQWLASLILMYKVYICYFGYIRAPVSVPVNVQNVLADIKIVLVITGGGVGSLLATSWFLK